MYHISTSRGWIAMKCETDVNGAKRTKPNDFGELLAFSGAPPSGQNSL